jgi:hypothetical protein
MTNEEYINLTPKEKEKLILAAIKGANADQRRVVALAKKRRLHKARASVACKGK